jgi:putative phage-type endonuclease
MNAPVNLATIEQGSEAWIQARLGRLTASRVADATARTKTGWGASRANLMAALIAERLTGVQQETFTNAAMQWGTTTEPEARAAYEFRRDTDVTQVGLIEHPTIPMSGASPDGLVGADGMVEFKCPGTATHIDTLLGASIDGRYVKQMQWQMACAGRAWCDFVSYDPRLPEHMRLHITRLKRDDETIAELEKEVRAFLDELDAKVAKLRTAYEAAA